MEKVFELKEMWFNSTDNEVILSGILHKAFLQYDTKVRLPIQRLNALVNILQKNNEGFDLYDHMCCFNLGFITEYNVVLPQNLNRNFTQLELLGEAQAPLKQIRA
jgi:hypothetical protein